MIRIGLFFLASLLQGGCSLDSIVIGSARDRESTDTPRWEEAEATIPPFPRDADLVRFQGSGAVRHTYFIDARSLRVGADGVVRYVVVVRSSGGARNVSFEGIRCQTREKRTYAHGRSDNEWSVSRLSRWEPIRLGAPNEYQAGLYTDYFCPKGGIVQSPHVALQAMRVNEAGSSSEGRGQ